MLNASNLPIIVRCKKNLSWLVSTGDFVPRFEFFLCRSFMLLPGSSTACIVSLNASSGILRSAKSVFCFHMELFLRKCAVWGIVVIQEFRCLHVPLSIACLLLSKVSQIFMTFLGCSCYVLRQLAKLGRFVEGYSDLPTIADTRSATSRR